MPSDRLVFFIDEPPQGLDPNAYYAEVRAAFAEWQRVSDGAVTFSEGVSPSSAHVVVGMRSANHAQECDDGFSASTTLAHAFTHDNGCLAGTIHLNEDVAWVMNGSNRAGTYDLQAVVLHEVGHLLGLPHINDPGHVMNEQYQGVIRRLTEAEAEDLLAVLDGLE